MDEWFRRRRRARLERIVHRLLEPSEALVGGAVGLTRSLLFLLLPLSVAAIVVVFSSQLAFDSPLRWAILAVGIVVGNALTSAVFRWWIVTDRRMLITRSSPFIQRPTKVVEELPRTTPVSWSIGSMGGLRVTLASPRGSQEILFPKAHASDIFAIFDALHGPVPPPDGGLPPPPPPR